MKTDFDRAKGKALFILFIENAIDPMEQRTFAELNADYHAQIPDHLLEPAFLHWDKNGLAKATSYLSPIRIRLRRDAYGEAYQEVLKFLGATTLTVKADLREIFSDADCDDSVPMRDGWKWFTYENPSRPVDIARTNDSHVQHVAPIPPKIPLWRREINWTKWGAIAAWVIIPVTILGIVITIVLDKN